MSLFEKTANHHGIVIAGIVKLPAKTVEIYGEIHGQKNDFCEEIIKKNLLHSYTVLCEHSSLLCDIKKSEYRLFENIATGSEYNYDLL